MGSKSAMLGIGLGAELDRVLLGQGRFIDLFAGSGAVAQWVATRHRLPVISADLQEYSAILSGAVIGRETPADRGVLNNWIAKARRSTAVQIDRLGEPSEVPIDSNEIERQRTKADSLSGASFLVGNYGGHYFSIRQAVGLAALLDGAWLLPRIERQVALSSTIQAASDCAAAPGHTAQPFQPTGRLVGHIASAWSRDPISRASDVADRLVSRHALVKGAALVEDATRLAARLTYGDVVFCDPPYSEAQYSRFYHVLEGIARGGWGTVSGAGRAPNRSVRASSDFSSRARSTSAFRNLFETLASRECRVVLTFPNANCSNGQSAQSLIALASPWFKSAVSEIALLHSSLGGTPGLSNERKARTTVNEWVIDLVLR